MKTIKTIKNNTENLIVIEKSKFIAFSYLINSDEQVSSLLDELSKKYYDATHICYAFSVGSKQKCSDDGEPQGTAGKPILDCITKKKLNNVLVAVVRYFGGIKLGAGGLTRAYSNSASEVLELSGVVELSECVKFEFNIMPKEIKKVEQLKKNPNVKQTKTIFGEIITVQVICEKLQTEHLIQFINNLLCRNIEICNREELFY